MNTCFERLPLLARFYLWHIWDSACFPNKLQVVSALLVAGSSLTFWITWQTPFASTSSYSSVVQRARLLGTIEQHGHHVTCALNRTSRKLATYNCSSHGGQNKDRTLLQCSQHCHKGEFGHISISARQQSLRCGQNLRGPFLRATLPMIVGWCVRAMTDNGGDKRAHNYTTRVSFCTIIRLCHCMIAITRV